MKYRELKYIGTTLRRLRMSNQLSQAELAKLSSVDTKSISNLEINKQEPLLSTICKLAVAFKMKPSEFIEEVQKDSERAFHS